MYKLKKDLRLKVDTLKGYKSLDGKLVIENGYACIQGGWKWDGMTCWREGKLTDLTDANGNTLPKSWKGSCLHDILYRYYFVDKEFLFTRTECDKLLISQLAIDGAYSAFERKLIYLGLRTFGKLRGIKSTAIILEKTPNGLGVLKRVYNKDRKFGENNYHYYILILEDAKEFWIRLTAKQLRKAKEYPLKNVEDIPKM